MSLNQIYSGNSKALASANLQVNNINANHFSGLGLSSGTGDLVAGVANVVDPQCSATSYVIVCYAEATVAADPPLGVVAGAGSFDVSAGDAGTSTKKFNYIILN